MIEGLDPERRFHAVGDETGVRVWYVDRLWQEAAELPSKPVALSTLDVLDREAWFSGRAPTLGQVVAHLRRIQAADLAHPIILGADGRVMDGLHRVARVLVEGGSSIEAVRFDVDPAPDLHGPWVEPGPREALLAQVEAWNGGDLEGYLSWVHPQVVYQHGEVVITGVDALREHYRGRVTGQLQVQVVREQLFADQAVIVVDATLAGWRGQALLCWRKEREGWRLVGDATETRPARG